MPAIALCNATANVDLRLCARGFNSRSVKSTCLADGPPALISVEPGAQIFEAISVRRNCYDERQQGSQRRTQEPRQRRFSGQREIYRSRRKKSWQNRNAKRD